MAIRTTVVRKHAGRDVGVDEVRRLEAGDRQTGEHVAIRRRTKSVRG